MNLIEELRWRGMLQDMMPGTEEQLQKEMTTAYIGFDPTAESLHIGSLVPILLLVHLQKAGHKPLALVGGATGMVGDPSFKAEERKMLDLDTLQKNVAGIKAQLERFLDFDPAKPNAAEMVNNFDWFQHISFLDFIRDTGKHITVNYMMAKDSVKKRIEGDNGMSFTEFTYQLIQGYDFYHLYTAKNCKLQMGGSDQWGNIVTGTELIRRKARGEAFAFTCPLIKKADGTKFGKTESGTVWLDAKRTSPYAFYQFWLRTTDVDAESYIRIFTFMEQAEIEDLIAQHRQDPGQRLLQKRLAKEVTVFIHGEENYNFAVEASSILFNKDTAALLSSLSEEDLMDLLNNIPKYEISRAEIEVGKDIVSLAAESGLLPSKSEARKMVQGGGVSVNKVKASGIDMIVNTESLLRDKYILLQKGKTYIVIQTV
ncbi:tyrosine--tRNA ligase [Chitinophaga polysaccharea]|uniref:tyrosine--tRNA ligase n=1 Tax=Chitinophaga TaxID=79328 RepID=UPI0014558EF3|nr:MULTISPECIES: tyrosine--tRNA ligase [Chitinophaga]NLR60997.1 tyrosine--tRNA ligase [Chitinophaga polysaccharea]NLU94629.1 tyrosine--tRNA ligase [Chitinophaga sp. Ak27]